MAQDDFSFINPRPIDRSTKPMFVGTARQLFFDDFLLHMADPAHWDQLAYGVRFSLGPVQKSDGPIMVSDALWETSMAWLSVLREEGLYRMWYCSSHEDRRGGRVSYAESDDGLSWRRPALNELHVAGCKDHNIVFEGGRDGNSPEFGTVFKDPVAQPGEEYKMVYAEWVDRDLFEAGQTSNGALRGASSPDGIHWQRYRENFTRHYPDSQNVAMWDPTLEKYVVYHRALRTFAGLEAGSLRVAPQRRGRSVVRLESGDFRLWSEHEDAVMPDLEDGMNTDIYNSAYSRHPDNVNAHYMFPSFYRHCEGTFEVQALTSRDNRNWARPCRDTFIPLGSEGEFDCYIISVAPGLIPVDDDRGPSTIAPATAPTAAAGRWSSATSRRVASDASPSNGTGSSDSKGTAKAGISPPGPSPSREAVWSSTPSRPVRMRKSAFSCSLRRRTIRLRVMPLPIAGPLVKTVSTCRWRGTAVRRFRRRPLAPRCASTSRYARCESTPSSSSSRSCRSADSTSWEGAAPAHHRSSAAMRQ